MHLLESIQTYQRNPYIECLTHLVSSLLLEMYRELNDVQFQKGQQTNNNCRNNCHEIIPTHSNTKQLSLQSTKIKRY